MQKEVIVLPVVLVTMLANFFPRNLLRCCRHRKHGPSLKVLLAVMFLSWASTTDGLEFIPEAFVSSALGSSAGNETGRAITTDPLGNIYVVGVASAFATNDLGESVVSTVRDSEAADELPTIVFSTGMPTPGTDEAFSKSDKGQKPRKGFTGAEDSDVIIVKVQVNGEISWIRRFGSELNDKVNSIAYRHGVLYVAGSTYGSIDSKDTPDGTSDAFVMAFKEDGEPAWPQPLQFGSGGNDSIESIALDSSTQHGIATCPFIYVAGRIGGNAFRNAAQMEKEEALCNCHTTHLGLEKDTATNGKSDSPLNATTTRSMHADSSVDKQQQDLQHVSAHGQHSSDAFIAKLTLDGSIEDAVQIPLKFDNSVHDITTSEGKLYVAVNTFEGEPLGSTGSSALLIACSGDLSYRTVYVESEYSHRGDFVQGMAVDGQGNAYLAGITVQENAEVSNYFVRKYSTSAKQFMWETQIGATSMNIRPPKVNIAYGHLTDQLYVAGHGRGFFELKPSARFANLSTTERTKLHEAEEMARRAMNPQLRPGNGPPHGILRTGLTVLSAGDGKEIITWDKLVPIPGEYEDTQSIALDENENMVYTGRRQNKNSGSWDLCLGSFGSQIFSSSSRSASEVTGNENAELATPLHAKGEEAAEMGSVITGLVVIAASITLMSMGAAFILTRSFLLGRHVMAPSGGYLYEYQNGDLSRFEQNAQRKYAAGIGRDNDELYCQRAASSRSVSTTGSSILMRRTISRSQKYRSYDDDMSSGGSADPRKI